MLARSTRRFSRRRHYPGIVGRILLDGNPGLIAAVREAWPAARLQRCTLHKLRNLLAKAPKHCHAELKRNYHAIIYADSADGAQSACEAFVRKWSRLSIEVVRSLEEAGAELLTFTSMPKSQWKSLRSTNHIERLNGEFRRRTKTQGSFCNEDAALVLLSGLMAMGQINLRRFHGCLEMPKAMQILNKAA